VASGLSHKVALISNSSTLSQIPAEVASLLCGVPVYLPAYAVLPNCGLRANTLADEQLNMSPVLRKH